MIIKVVQNPLSELPEKLSLIYTGCADTYARDSRDSNIQEAIMSLKMTGDDYAFVRTTDGRHLFINREVLK